MKRKNIAKRFGIASLCLGVAVSAFSGIASLATNNVAIAEETTASVWEDFITASEGAEVDIQARNVYYGKNSSRGSIDCLRVSSSSAYEASFNRVFMGNTTLRFTFPEKYTDLGAAASFDWGTFTFRITDATDDSNFFDLVYQKTGSNGTTLLVTSNGHTVQSYNPYTANKTGYTTASFFYDKMNTVASANVAPSIGQTSAGSYDTREGRLVLQWSGDVLQVLANSCSNKGDTSDNYTGLVAKFDGSYNEALSSKGFSDGTSWGMPKMSFPNGYKITFFSDTGENDAIDVSFWAVVNGGKTYKFDGSTDDITETNHNKAYDVMEANAGKTLIGWKDADGALQTMATALASADITAYEPVFLGFDTIDGASIRIDTSEGGQSGIRFMSLFDPTDYESAADYIQSFGTLLARTNRLYRGNFNAYNYAKEIEANADDTTNKIYQIYQVVNTKGLFEYTDPKGDVYNAYSMALVNIANYELSYSARGYVVVVYADETTQTFYTDYNKDDNARSIAQVAYNLKTDGTAEYNTYTDAQKAIVDNFAAPLETVE